MFIWEAIKYEQWNNNKIPFWYLRATKSKSSLPAVNICLSVEVHTEGWENPDQNIKEDL